MWFPEDLEDSPLKIFRAQQNITYPIYLGPPLPKPLGGHHMVPFGQNAAAVIGGQSSNLTIQDEIHVFRRVLLSCHKIRGNF